VTVLNIVNTNCAVGNLQLSLEKLQLPASSNLSNPRRYRPTIRLCCSRTAPQLLTARLVPIPPKSQRQNYLPTSSPNWLSIQTSRRRNRPTDHRR